MSVMQRICRTTAMALIAVMPAATLIAQNPNGATNDDLLEKIRLLEARIGELEQTQNTADTSALEGSIAELTDRLDIMDEDGWAFKWDKTFRLKSGDGNFSLKFGGRIMNDWAFLTQDNDLEDAFGHFNDNTEFRRARLYFAGTIYGRIIFKAQYDFAGSDADFKDVYMGVKEIPFAGTVKAGHFKEPMGLEQLTSSKYITFMERSVATEFTPSRNTGLAAQNTAADDRIWWSLGVFRQADDDGDSPDFTNVPDDASRGDDGAYAVTFRLAGQPIWQDDGKTALHLGVGLSYRAPDKQIYRLRARPDVHTLQRLVDTGSLNDVEDVLLLNGEFAFVWNSLSIQAEAMASFVESDAADDPEFFAFYVQASYWLTGEARPYEQGSATFGRVLPHDNAFNGEGGIGAWELAARYSYIDLNDGNIRGGEMQVITIGLNWHLNPNTRVMFNYTYADVCDKETGPAVDNGEGHFFQVRFQIDF